MECDGIISPESSIQMSPKFIIMLLMGLPGSGKTTLCRSIPYALGDKYYVLHVCFDHIVQFREEWSDEGCYGKWKNERSKLLLAVEGLIKSLMIDKDDFKCKKTDSHNAKDSEPVSSEHKCLLESETLEDVGNEVIPEKHFGSISNLSEKSGGRISSQNSIVSDVKVPPCDNNDKFGSENLHGKYYLITDSSNQDLNLIHQLDVHDKKILLCVDDNFYYHSMRKEWWNLAVKYELAFCTLVVSCEIETCIDRVKKRESLYSHPSAVHVPIDVIKRMSKNLELPNDKLYHWEKHWSVIDTSDLKFTISQSPGSLSTMSHVFDEIAMEIFENIDRLLIHSLSDPAKPLTVGMKSDSFIATPSIIHEVDLVLRKVVGRSEKSLKAVVNKKRKDILEDLKNGKLYIPEELTGEKVSDKEMLEKFVVTLIDLEGINLE